MKKTVVGAIGAILLITNISVCQIGGWADAMDYRCNYKSHH